MTLVVLHCDSESCDAHCHTWFSVNEAQIAVFHCGLAASSMATLDRKLVQETQRCFWRALHQKCEEFVVPSGWSTRQAD